MSPTFPTAAPLPAVPALGKSVLAVWRAGVVGRFERGKGHTSRSSAVCSARSASGCCPALLNDHPSSWQHSTCISSIQNIQNSVAYEQDLGRCPRESFAACTRPGRVETARGKKHLPNSNCAGVELGQSLEGMRSVLPRGRAAKQRGTVPQRLEAHLRGKVCELSLCQSQHPNSAINVSVRRQLPCCRFPCLTRRRISTPRWGWVHRVFRARGARALSA